MHAVTQHAVLPRSIGVLLQSRNIRHHDSSAPNRPYQVHASHQPLSFSRSHSHVSLSRWCCSGTAEDTQEAGSGPEQWVDDAADDGDALCKPEDMSPSVEYVRWSDVPLQSLDVSWTDTDYLKEQQAYKSGQDDTRTLQNKVQLSTYANHIGENLHDLHHFLTSRLQGAIGGVHLLPIYPSSGDGGFAPLTYKEVDPAKGTWEDVADFAEHYDVTMELMVNHISPASAEFQDYLQHGDKSQFADMFIDWDRFWPDGNPTKKQLAEIRTRKAEAPVLTVDLEDGSQKRVWCTFGPQQIDIDPFSASGSTFLSESLHALGERRCKMVRLDAFGYATKIPGTRCFMEEPMCWELLEKMREIGKSAGLGLLCEVHEEFRTNIELAKRGFWVYDFALPLLLLHACTFKTGANMRNWLRICPRRQITVLDTHDGMGIDDIEGLAEVVEVEAMKQVVQDKLGCGPNFKYHYRLDKDVYEGAPHQFNCTYFSALGGNARLYLMCRAIQFFTPGIPMVYYVGLFAGRNDWDNVKPEDGSTRGINRHRYSLEEADKALEQPVVEALLRLCKFRNTHPAFNGQITVPDADGHKLEVLWTNGPHKAHLFVDFEAQDFHTVVTREEEGHRMHSVRYTLESLGMENGKGSHLDPPTNKAKMTFADA